jgi:hypothetical protein
MALSFSRQFDQKTRTQVGEHAAGQPNRAIEVPYEQCHSASKKYNPKA